MLCIVFSIPNTQTRNPETSLVHKTTHEKVIIVTPLQRESLEQ
jgi:hypothetical protein